MLGDAYYYVAFRNGASTLLLASSVNHSEN